MGKAVLLFFLLFGLSAQGHICKKFEGGLDYKTVENLALKLNYSFEEFCNSNRILDIQKEIRYLYNYSADQSLKHQVFTLHYNEYSCEYHYVDFFKSWDDERAYCYNTF